MLVPFTTMAALGGGAANLSTVDPVATLSHITAAIQDTLFPFGQPAALTLSPGAVSSCYSQRPAPAPAPPGYSFLPAARFAHITSHNGNAHACIGEMLYHTAMIASVIT